MMTMYPTVRVKILDKGACLPKYAHEWDAGMDLCTMQTVDILPHETVMVGTGVAVAIPNGFEGEVRPRSGMASKRGVTIANAPGTIDAHYRGEIMLPLHNLTDETVTVERGERVVQLLVNPVATATMVEVDELDETERGSDGFGSTGTRYERP